MVECEIGIYIWVSPTHIRSCDQSRHMSEHAEPDFFVASDGWKHSIVDHRGYERCFVLVVSECIYGCLISRWTGQSESSIVRKHGRGTASAASASADS